MDKVAWNNVNQNYIKASRDLAVNIRNKADVSDELHGRYTQALNQLREFLDNNNIQMPKSKWRFNIEDQRTWPFLDVVLGDKLNKRSYRGVILNPEFGYVNKLLKFKDKVFYPKA